MRILQLGRFEVLDSGAFLDAGFAPLFRTFGACGSWPEGAVTVICLCAHLSANFSMTTLQPVMNEA